MSIRGFSLIELLIVVAIIAALVGVAVPFFSDNLEQAQKTKALQDLDTIRNAIGQHDSQNRPLTGTSLAPLLGRYLQELPADPWGNEYALDANVGLVISFGADAQAFGRGGDEDLYFYYKAPITIQRAQYIGPWGRPKPENKFIISLTKPYEFSQNTPSASWLRMSQDLYLLTNTRDKIYGGMVSFSALNAAGQPHDWGFDNFTTDTSPGRLDPVSGIIALVNNTNVTGTGQSITPTMSINFHYTPALPGSYSRFGLTERWLENGPLDNAIYGGRAQDYRRPPLGVPIVGSGSDRRNRGVKIERF